MTNCDRCNTDTKKLYTIVHWDDDVQTYTYEDVCRECFELHRQKFRADNNIQLTWLQFRDRCTYRVEGYCEYENKKCDSACKLYDRV